MLNTSWRYGLAVFPWLVLGSTTFASEVPLKFDEVTNLAATVSPDGNRAILDIQGILWRLDMASGETVKLTEPGLDPARPHWGPSGDLIVMQAYQNGTFDIWTMDSNGEGLKQPLSEGNQMRTFAILSIMLNWYWRVVMPIAWRTRWRLFP